MLSGKAEPLSGNVTTTLCHTGSILSKTHGSSKKYKAKLGRPEFPSKGQQTAWRQHGIKLQTTIKFYKSVVASKLFWCRVKLGPTAEANNCLVEQFHRSRRNLKYQDRSCNVFGLLKLKPHL